MCSFCDQDSVKKEEFHSKDGYQVEMDLCISCLSHLEHDLESFYKQNRWMIDIAIDERYGDPRVLGVAANEH